MVINIPQQIAKLRPSRLFILRYCLLQWLTGNTIQVAPFLNIPFPFVFFNFLRNEIASDVWGVIIGVFRRWELVQRDTQAPTDSFNIPEDLIQEFLVSWGAMSAPAAVRYQQTIRQVFSDPEFVKCLIEVGSNRSFSRRDPRFQD